MLKLSLRLVVAGALKMVAEKKLLEMMLQLKTLKINLNK